MARKSTSTRKSTSNSDHSMLRNLSPEEQANIAAIWEASEECALLNERRNILKDKIGQRAGIYSNRC